MASHILLIVLLIIETDSVLAWTRAYESAQVFDSSSGFIFVWNYTETTVFAGFSVFASGWAGIGLSSTHPGSMTDADIVLAYVSTTGKVMFGDYYSIAPGVPIEDPSQDVILVSGSKSLGKLEFEFSRLLVTPDTEADFAWDPCQATPVIWAYNLNQIPVGGEPLSHTVKSRGATTVKLCPNCRVPSHMAPPTLVSKSTSSIAITWAPPAIIGGSSISYTIRIGNATNGAYTVGYVGAETKFNFTSLLPGIRYRITAEASNCAGSGGASSPLEVATNEMIPPAPDPPFIIGATSSSLTVSWTPLRIPVIGYNLYFSNATADSWKRVYSGMSTNFTQIGLEAYQAYNFQLSASNYLGSGPNSSVATFRTAKILATVPGPPTSLTAIPETRVMLKLLWNVPIDDGGSPIIEYSVYYAKSNHLAWTLGYRGRGNTGAEIDSLAPETNYDIMVSARNSIGPGPNSSIIVISTGEGSNIPASLSSPPVINTAPILPNDYFSSITTVSGALNISWAVFNGSLSIRMVCFCTGWDGFGFGASMINTDIIIGRVVDGLPYVGDYWSESFSAPSLDTALGGTSDIISFSGSESNGVTEIKFVKTLITSDTAHDAQIQEGPSDVIVAFNSNDDVLNFHGPNTDSLKVDFFKRSSAISPTSPHITAARKAHGAIMFISWGILLPFGVLWIRYTRNAFAISALWFKVHRIVQISGFLFAICGIIAIFSTEAVHFATVWHSQMGVAVMFAGVVQIVIAFIRSDRAVGTEKKKLKRLIWEIQHLVCGRITIIGAILAIFSGLANVGASALLIGLYGALVAAVGVFVFVMEILKWRQKSREAESK